MVRSAFPVALLSVFSLTLLAPTVRAQSNYDVTATGTISAISGGGIQSQNWSLDKPNQLQTGFSDSVVVPGANARGGSSAEIGRLKAFGFTNALFGQVPPAYSQTASGNVIATSQWYDHITVTSSSLAVNTPVVLAFTYELDGNIYVHDLSSEGQLARVEAHVDVSDGSSAQSIAFNYSNAGIGQQMQTVTFNTFVGDRLQVRGDLETDAVAYSYNADHFANESDVDFGDTANLYIASATPGAFYVADSGHVYTADVPEPTGAALLMSLIVFGGILKRSRRSLPRSR